MDITKFIPSGTLSTLGRASLKLQKHAPEILTGLGVVGTVVSGVLLVRAGMKTAPIIEAHKEELGEIKGAEIDDKSKKEFVAQRYFETSKQIAYLYGPAVLLGVSSLSCFVGGHGVLKKRHMGTVAALKAVQSNFKSYREDVAKEIGDDRERQIYRGEEEIEVVDEKGKKKKEIVRNKHGHSPYARCFDQLSSNWDKIPEMNLTFLRAVEESMNRRLNTVGHVFLNDVYRELDIPVSQAGQIVGWLKDGGPDGTGDGYIDFGLYDIQSEQGRRFVNGYEAAVWIDPNVDGEILHQI